MVLPFGQAPETMERGHTPSAPEKPRLLKKMLITSVITPSYGSVSMQLYRAVFLHLESREQKKKGVKTLLFSKDNGSINRAHAIFPLPFPRS